jgi:putative protease
VVDQTREKITRIKLSDTVSRGYGLVIWVGQGQSPAFIINEMKVDGKNTSEAQSGQVIEVQLEGRVFPNDRVFKTHDEKLLSEARDSINKERGHKIPVFAEIYLKAGQTMKLVLNDHKDNRVEIQSQKIAQPADQHPLNEEILSEKIGRLGNTPFELRHIKVYGDQNVVLPVSDINDTRRRAVDLLTDKILQKNQSIKTEAHNYWQEKNKYLDQQQATAHIMKTQLSVSVSRTDHAEIAFSNGADVVYIGMDGIHTHRHPNQSQIEQLFDKHRNNKECFIPILPRIHKPADKYLYREFVSRNFNTIMISSWADLQWGLKSGLNVLADYSLNVFNRYTMGYLIRQGVNGICLTPELNFDQLKNFGDLNKVELLVHGELILMQSQYCMLGDVLGGKSKKCTAPCNGKGYYIKDSKGFEFPLETDADCRFYIFNSRTLCMMEDLPRILSMRPASIRIEARRYSDNQLAETVKLYREALDKIHRNTKPDLAVYQQELNDVSNSSFTKGHYYRGVL